MACILIIDDDETVRAATLRGLIAVEGPDALSVIRPLLRDPRPAVRITASDALGFLATPEAREALQVRLDSETDPQVRTALERALARSMP